jgi:hypothetical protein
MAKNPYVVMFVEFAGDGDTSTWHATAYPEFNALKLGRQQDNRFTVIYCYISEGKSRSRLHLTAITPYTNSDGDTTSFTMGAL